MNQVKLLHQVAMAIYNTKGEADILRQLSKFSYDMKSLQSAENLYNQFQALILEQEDAQLAVKEATRATQQARLHLQEKYMKHVAVARLIFKDQEHIYVELGLKGKRQNRLENSLKQCQHFYYHAAKHMDEFEQYNISAASFEEMQGLISEIVRLNALQKSALSRAQVLTQKKQEVGNSLLRWYNKFIKVARLALDSEPQQLEALGIVVKA